ncbi:hypothetical protein TSUD_94560 [Trifolium subterraneum]|uniref:Uncharacterized protein n=1 Tax=Trifolium subterraneum TaxID=3900 RepID=A0A2Z6NM22_TRISU|nr:hypothetical protein TSUD_94560 [Trifolium subterraneum]
MPRGILLVQLCIHGLMSWRGMGERQMEILIYSSRLFWWEGKRGRVMIKSFFVRKQFKTRGRVWGIFNNRRTPQGRKESIISSSFLPFPSPQTLPFLFPANSQQSLKVLLRSRAGLIFKCRGATKT